MARFATEKYKAPKNSNLQNLFMHLTNYAINKNHANYEEGDLDNKGSKRFLSYILKHIEENENNFGVWERIKEMCIKTLIAVQPALAHSYRAAKPQAAENSLCFQILGFDIMLDQKLRPWLLEVNHSPSLSTDSQLDFLLKYNLVKDTMKMLNLSPAKKANYKKRKQKEQKDRIFGKNGKFRFEPVLMRKKTKETTEIEDIDIGRYLGLYIRVVNVRFRQL